MEITADMLRRLPQSVEHDDSLSEAEYDDQLTLGKLMTSQVWTNLLTKAESKEAEGEVVV